MAARGPKSDKIWADAVRRAVNRRLEGKSKNPKYIEQLADNLVKFAAEGEGWAMKEIGDRLDGKPAQAVTHSGDADNPVNLVTKVEVEIVEPEKTGR